MTYKEALEQLAYDKFLLLCTSEHPENVKLEEIKIAKDCIEKQIPKKPLNVTYDDEYLEYWNCPNCHIQHSEEYKTFCPDCGQAIDWSVEK